MTDTAADGRPWVRTLGPLIVVATGLSMLAWTWRAWPDPIVDFGRELYVPWRLAEGDALFRDVAWFNGPLSPYWNALWFRVFGASLTTLVGVNLVLLAATTALLYRLIARIADRTAATTGCTLFLAVFAFGQYVGIANYNWLCPYSHEATHGTTLALAALAAADAFARRPRVLFAAAVGLAIGLAFLTKVEAVLAAGAASAVVLIPAGLHRNTRAAVACAVGAALPIALSIAFVSLRGTLGAWPSVVGGEVSELPFYRAGMGLDRPGERAFEALRWAAGWLFVFAPATIAAWYARGSRAATGWVAAIAGALYAGALLAFGDQVVWTNALRPLSMFALAATVAVAVAANRCAETRARWTTALGLGVLALAMLAKMMLNTRVDHYGFALALPATLLAVTALVGWIPRVIDRAGGRGAVLRVAALVALGFGAFQHLRITAVWLGRKTTVVATGRDAFRADPRGLFVNDALASVRDSGARTMAVLPEGVMLNYLARVPNPTPYINFMPPEAILFGEDAWLDTFRATPPDLILTVPKDTSEYGRGAFGVGYGEGLMSWVERAYRPVRTIQRPPIPFEIEIRALGRSP